MDTLLINPSLRFQIKCLAELEDTDYQCLKDTENEAKVEKWMKYRYNALNRTPQKCKTPVNKAVMIPTTLQFPVTSTAAAADHSSSPATFINTTSSPPVAINRNSIITTAAAQVLHSRNIIHNVNTLLSPIATIEVETSASYHRQTATGPTQSPRFKQVQQEWDYDNPCPHCGYVSLGFQLSLNCHV